MLERDERIMQMCKRNFFYRCNIDGIEIWVSPWFGYRLIRGNQISNRDFRRFDDAVATACGILESGE